MGLPISTVMVRANSSLRARNPRAALRMDAARSATGTPRHSRKAACAPLSARSTSAGDVGAKVSTTSPVAGFTDWIAMAGLLLLLSPVGTSDRHLIVYPGWRGCNPKRMLALEVHMKASDVIARCLENEGVRYVFGVPGEEILDIIDSLVDSSIRFIPTRHEQGAAFMADAYGRLTGRAGVCLSTLGPGATNLATGVADANLDHAPLVAITGQAGRDRIHKESHQYVDIVELMRPLTKWNARAEMPVVIPEVIRKAFKVAEAEKPGACHIEVPEDVAEDLFFNDTATTERPRRPSPDRQALQSAARLIEAASFPFIFSGNGVIRGGDSRELRDFSRAHGIPVVNTFMAKGCRPYDDPLALLTAGLQARDYISCGFEKADLII